MNESPLLSREWNDLVFENRNKQYGAYVLRKETGKRYRRVGMIFLGVFLVLAVIAGVLGYFVYKKVQEISTEINEEVKHLEPVKTRDGFERKNISVGRRAVKVATKTSTTTPINPISPSKDRNSPPPKWWKRCRNSPADTKRW